MRTLMAAILLTLLVAAASVWYGSGSDVAAERGAVSTAWRETTPPSGATKNVAASESKSGSSDTDDEPAPFWNSGRPLTDF